MGGLKTTSLVNQPTVRGPANNPNDPARVRAAAQQFEALLLEQILRTVHEGGGWLGSGADASSDCAASFAEQQFASLLAQQGGLGLADLISAGLERRR